MGRKEKKAVSISSVEHEDKGSMTKGMKLRKRRGGPALKGMAQCKFLYGGSTTN